MGKRTGDPFDGVPRRLGDAPESDAPGLALAMGGEELRLKSPAAAPSPPGVKGEFDATPRSRRVPGTTCPHIAAFTCASPCLPIVISVKEWPRRRSAPVPGSGCERVPASCNVTRRRSAAPGSLCPCPCVPLRRSSDFINWFSNGFLANACFLRGLKFDRCAERRERCKRLPIGVTSGDGERLSRDCIAQ